MCGISGFLFDPATVDADAAQRMLESSTRAIKHRGPDGAGHWIDADAGVALGHRRLAILDLSSAGDQPMPSPSGRYMIVYNGEIYNHLEMRNRLEASAGAQQWRGHSDTETLLACIEAWGIRDSLKLATGMFAFALWDRSERTLTLGRDRLGEKPLYYGWQGGGKDAVFLFGSELKALTAHPAFEGEIDREAVTLMMRHNCVPAPYSIYRGIRKLPPGFILTLDHQRREPTAHRYWAMEEAVEAGIRDPFRGSPKEAVDALESLLMDSVGRQMIADVPLGAFLSGGIDSSTIVALMQAQSARPVKTFSIGFHEEGYDEAQHAKAVASHLGTDHTELYVTAEQAMAVIPRLPALYDEPFADASQIPTFLVSQLARDHVAVSLSGDAGDELFAGYNRYQMTEKLWGKISAVPKPLRRMAARGLTSISPGGWRRIARAGRAVAPGLNAFSHLDRKIDKGARALASDTSDELYLGMVSHWMDPSALVIGGSEPPTRLTGDRPALAGLGDVERMMALDLITYLPDDILAKVDRAAMGVSLETRVPFLDHRVVEFAWRLPLELKLRNGQTKWALREVLNRHVPRALIERPKMGFALPVGSWLRGPLRDWAEALLDERRLREEGFFDPAPIRRMWTMHQSRQADLQYHLWDVLMFQSWLEDRSAPAGSAHGDASLRRAVG